MLARRASQILLSLWVALAWTGVVCAQTFPDPVSTTINDFADLLPDTVERRLSDRLARLERDTGVEMTVVTLATRQVFAPDMTIEAFARALFDRWGIGKAETNDGVLVLVLRDDREMRLELGAAYARDWDRVARGIVERDFVTAFAEGDYPRGIETGTEAVIREIVMPFRGGEDAPSGGMRLPDWLVMAGVLAVAVFAMARRRIGDLAVRLRRCPNCGRYGLSQTRSTLTTPTRMATGLGERLRRCSHCDYEDRTTFTVPRTGNSGSGGSFGGGRSGGGGASGRW
ncbi:TPM domain-containing protein [Roseibacterium sp. SDUM158016]|uniref:TPM domain-containing protein n=1 Tax=Roseicyclus sediminis TaxID=2980997 RepID=UPI0021D0306B|nr:TPM domain-containing protein [Roseibacterium sp. SDUM158016]MCU4653848.1 TPM domain-containing protein [Roseibacterium sp. SDUM158016]